MHAFHFNVHFEVLLPLCSPALPSLAFLAPFYFCLQLQKNVHSIIIIGMYACRVSSVYVIVCLGVVGIRLKCCSFEWIAENTSAAVSS